LTEDELTGLRITLPDFDEISLGNAPIRVFIHPAGTKEYMLQNDGIAPLSPFSTISGPTNGFTVITALSPDAVLPERNLTSWSGSRSTIWFFFLRWRAVAVLYDSTASI